MVMESSGESASKQSDQHLMDIELKIKNHIKTLKTLRDADETHSSLTSFGKSTTSSVTPMDIFFFNQRVKSSQITTWFNKPFVVNPLQCARYGFINIGTDKLECCQCKTRKILKSSFDHIKISNEVLEKRALDFCEELKTSHTKQCVFFNQPSPLRFTLFSHQDTSSGKDSNITKIHCFQFHNLMKKFRKINKNLHVNLKLEQSFVNEYFKSHSLLINRILDKMHVEDVEERELYTTFCWLSIFNWQISNKVTSSEDNSDAPPTLSCQHCQMTHHLKIKNNFLVNDGGENLHPHSMHRWWCPCVHANKLLVDYEQIEETEDETYITSLGKRQLNEEPGWKQMIDSISTGLASESELTHLHKDSLENEFNAATLVKNILSNSISSVFESEKKRKDLLKDKFDKIYYKNVEMVVAVLEINSSGLNDNSNLMKPTATMNPTSENNIIFNEIITKEHVASLDEIIIPSTTLIRTTPSKESTQTLLQMDISDDDDIEIDNSEIIIVNTSSDMSNQEQPNLPKVNVLHQTTLDNYFPTLLHHDNTESSSENIEEPIIEEVAETIEQQQPFLSNMNREEEQQEFDENIQEASTTPPTLDDVVLLPSLEKTNTTPSTPPTSESAPNNETELQSFTTESPATSSSSRSDLTTPLSAYFSEFEEKTPTKKKPHEPPTTTTSTTLTTPKTPFNESTLSTTPMSSSGSTMSDHQKHKAKPKPIPSSPSPHKISKDEQPSSSSSSSSTHTKQPPTNKSTTNNNSNRESSSSSNRKPPTRKPQREGSSTSGAESKKTSTQSDRTTNTRAEQSNKRKKPSGTSYQSGNPKSKSNKR